MERHYSGIPFQSCLFERFPPLATRIIIEYCLRHTACTLYTRHFGRLSISSLHNRWCRCCFRFIISLLPFRHGWMKAACRVTGTRIKAKLPRRTCMSCIWLLVELLASMRQLPTFFSAFVSKMHITTWFRVSYWYYFFISEQLRAGLV